MIIKLATGKELNPIMVTGAPMLAHGLRRDTLSFVFTASESMESLDEAFSPTACESITITGDDGSVNIHKAYTIRAKLEKSLVEVVPATHEAEAVTEERITVSMSQRTYIESQLASLTDTVDVLVMESLMS